MFRALHAGRFSLLALPGICLVSVVAAADDSTSQSISEADANAASAAAAKPATPLNSGTAPAQFSSDASKVTMEVLADGTRLYHMNGQGMQSVVAHRRADGSIEFTCSDRAEQAERQGLDSATANTHEQ